MTENEMSEAILSIYCKLGEQQAEIAQLKAEIEMLKGRVSKDDK